MKKITALFTLLLVLTLSTTLSASADSSPFQPIMEDYKAYLYSGILPSEDSLVNPQIAKLDGTFDYVIPVTVTANKIGMEMSMTQNTYLNMKDFPAKILMTIDDESYVLVFNLSPEGQVYFDQIPVDSPADLYPGC